MTHFDPSDVEKNRVLGGLGYLVFFLPFITCPDSRFGKACANQGLLALIAYVVISVAFWLLGLIFGWIPVLGFIVWLVGQLCYIALAVVQLYYTFLAVTKATFARCPSSAPTSFSSNLENNCAAPQTEDAFLWNLAF
jgi:hypothetical protein